MIFSRFRKLSGHLLGESCSYGFSYVHFVFLLFVILVISHSGFEGGALVLIASVPGHCLPFTCYCFGKK